MQSRACLIGMPPACALTVSTQLLDMYDAVPTAPYLVTSGADVDEQAAIGA